MKVYLLITHDSDDFDIVHGVFSTSESAELATRQICGCGSIKELELDVMYTDGVY